MGKAKRKPTAKVNPLAGYQEELTRSEHPNAHWGEVRLVDFLRKCGKVDQSRIDALINKEFNPDIRIKAVKALAEEVVGTAAWRG